MTKSARAFVIEPCSVDISDAGEHGKIVYVFKERENRPSIWSQEFLNEIVTRLDKHRFDPHCDFFVASGHFTPVIIVVASLLAHYHYLRVLFFHSATRNYVLKEMSFEKSQSRHVHNRQKRL